MLSVIPEDRSKDAWIAATWKQKWEASGPTRVHRHRRRRQGRRSEPKTLDASKPTANWGRSVQSIHEEGGLADSSACECGEPEQTADHYHQQLHSTSTTTRS